MASRDHFANRQVACKLERETYSDMARPSRRPAVTQVDADDAADKSQDKRAELSAQIQDGDKRGVHELAVRRHESVAAFSTAHMFSSRDLIRAPFSSKSTRFLFVRFNALSPFVIGDSILDS